MSPQKKLLTAGLIIATIILAIISVIIAITIGSRATLDNQTGAQTTPILANCDPITNICTISDGVCNPSKAYIHFCNDLKRDNEKCVSANPVQLSGSPFGSGQSIDLNDYLDNIDCGTAQIYLELESSGVTSLGACGTTVKKFSNVCIGSGTSTPTSFPQSQTVTGSTGTGTTNTGNDGGIQLAQPQFSIINTVTPSCESSGSALLNYRLTVTNTSTVSGTINQIKETFNTNLSQNNIVPNNVTVGGSFNNNIITWAGTVSERTFAAGQSKNYNYEIRIPLNLLDTYRNGISTTSTVTYNTSVAQDNTNTFELVGRYTCTVPTTSSTGSQNQLPNTAATENLTFFLIGLLFIILAVIFFRFEIGKKQVEKLIKNFRN